MDIAQFIIHSSFDEDLGCFFLLALWSDTAMNICIEVFMRTYFLQFSQEACGNSMFNTKKGQTGFQSGATTETRAGPLLEQ